MKFKFNDAFIQFTVASVLVLNMTHAYAASADQNMEKCYGITKAGMNDCETAGASCAGSAKVDRQADAYIFLPKGICDRIVGGKLTPPK